MTGRTEFVLVTVSSGALALMVSMCPPSVPPRPQPVRIQAAPTPTPTPTDLSRYDAIEDPLKRLNLKLRAVERKLEERQ